MEGIEAVPVESNEAPEVSENESEKNGATEARKESEGRYQTAATDREASKNGPKDTNRSTDKNDETPNKKRQQETVKVKVNGKEEEVRISEIVRDYQKYRGSEQRFEEAAQLKKENDSFREQMQGFFQDLQSGDTNRFKQVLGSEAAEALAEKILIDKMNYEGLTDEQRELLELKQENEKYKSAQEKFEDQRRQEQQQYAEAQAIQSIDAAVTEAFKADGSKPTPRLVARVAEVMLAHLDTNGGQLDANKALAIAKRDLYSEVGDYLENLPDEALLKTLPRSVQERIRKHSLKKAMDADPIKRGPTNKPRAGSRKKSMRMSTDDAFAQLEKKFGV